MSRAVMVAKALEDLASRLVFEDDGHVAFVVVVGAGDPVVHVCDDSGRARALTEVRMSVADADEEHGHDGGWTLEDLELASEWLHDIEFGRRIAPKRSPDDIAVMLVAAVQWASDQRARRTARAFEVVLTKAADDAAHPHVCGCGRRFGTERGLAMHRARAKPWMLARCAPPAEATS